jgi:hypothetical protein
VNVLYADGTPAFISYETLGVKPEDFKVGAESPIEAFRVLTNESSDPVR